MKIFKNQIDDNYQEQTMLLSAETTYFPSYSQMLRHHLHQCHHFCLSTNRLNSICVCPARLMGSLNRTIFVLLKTRFIAKKWLHVFFKRIWLHKHFLRIFLSLFICHLHLVSLDWNT